MKAKITGNIERIHGQTTARLVYVASAVSKELHPEVLRHYGGETPRGHCILYVYVGNLNITFCEIGRYSIGKLDKATSQVQMVFELEAGEEKQGQGKNLGFVQEELFDNHVEPSPPESLSESVPQDTESEEIPAS